MSDNKSTGQSVVSIPITLPTTFYMLEGSVTLPVTLPFTFGGGNNGVTLPVTLPMRFIKVEEDTTPKHASMPITLPMRFNNAPKRHSIKVPTSIDVEYGNERRAIKFSTQVKSQGNKVSVPVTEFSWSFEGLIIDENVVAKMTHEVLILEDIRSRILFDVELINRNLVKIKWYGEAVPGVQVMRKMEVDDEWTEIGTYTWEQSYALIPIDNNEYNIQLIGTNATGESGIVVIGETNYVGVLPQVGVSVNEKIYSADIDLTETYRIEVNF